MIKHNAGMFRVVKKTNLGLKQYIGISRDHSASMGHIYNAALNDYNSQIESIKTSSRNSDIETIVSVVKCGVGISGRVEREVVNSTVSKLHPLNSYVTDGGSTPLFDSVNELIYLLSAVPDKDDDKVSFLIIVITDGQNNSGTTTGEVLGRKIRHLQDTDKWTFVFRVPYGVKNHLISLGIPAGNIQEWEQTERGIKESTCHTQGAISSYFVGRTKGIRSTSTFYADLKAPKTIVQSNLVDISREVIFFNVIRGGQSIREFVESKIRTTMFAGTAFYQLTKPEKDVQEYKIIALRNKSTGAVYAGSEARNLLGLPKYGTIKLAPGDSPNYDIFIQSTSTNRNLIAGTEVMYWHNALKYSNI